MSCRVVCSHDRAEMAQAGCADVEGGHQGIRVHKFQNPKARVCAKGLRRVIARSSVFRRPLMPVDIARLEWAYTSHLVTHHGHGQHGTRPAALGLSGRLYGLRLRYIKPSSDISVFSIPSIICD
jgi:hypothetical protein